ncbi:hypothetical protein KY338_01930 [Candidatus Woesearchaeota archaeon]|nr:hypothetical protein [Candidatus Woesearchaeota archaeon]MBW3005964.1 hypothetical protein [Candidatus Woesearchaeota archaeon]
MKKQVLIYTIITILLAVFASAACYDSDDGPQNLDTPARYLGMDGFVTVGNTTYYDSCVNRQGGNEVNDSNWIREYYCDDNGDVAYEDYFCPSYYYVECLTFHKAAACDDYSGPSDYNETNASSSANTTNATNTTANNQTNTTTTPVNCGDNKVEFGEECDPPGKNCYTKAATKGVCDFNCACDPALTPELFKSLNRTLNQEKDTEVTSSVNFEIENITQETVVEEVKEVKNTTPAITGGITIDPINDLIKEAKQPGEDFSDSFGIKITSAITKAVMGVWNILMNLIGG